MSFGTERPTPGGYPISECISALQKEIRRGEIEGACYWAWEIVHTDKGGETWLWRRLAIISMEDVGPDPTHFGMIADLRALKEMYYESTRLKNRAMQVHTLYYAVAMLAMAPRKNRMVEALLANTTFKQNPFQKREVPDYALDSHTGRGRSMGRGDKHFFFEAVKLRSLTEEEIDAEYQRLQSYKRLIAEGVEFFRGDEPGYDPLWNRKQNNARQPDKSTQLL